MAEEQRCHRVLPSRRGVCAQRGTTAVHPRALLALYTWRGRWSGTGCQSSRRIGSDVGVVSDENSAREGGCESKVVVLFYTRDLSKVGK